MFVRADVSSKAWPYNADRENVGYMSEGGLEYGKETTEKRVCTHGVVKRRSHSHSAKLTGLVDEFTLNNLVIAMGGDPSDIETHSGTVEKFHFGEYMTDPYYEVQLISVRGDQKTASSMASGTVKTDQVFMLWKAKPESAVQVSAAPDGEKQFQIEFSGVTRDPEGESGDDEDYTISTIYGESDLSTGAMTADITATGHGYAI
jgi:hypothetical protein